MRYDTFQLECPASNASGAASDVSTYIDKWVQVTGTFSATIALEGTIDGSTYTPIASLTAPGLYEVPPAVNFLRCTVSSYASGTPAASFAGRSTSED